MSTQDRWQAWRPGTFTNRQTEMLAKGQSFDALLAERDSLLARAEQAEKALSDAAAELPQTAGTIANRIRVYRQYLQSMVSTRDDVIKMAVETNVKLDASCQINAAKENREIAFEVERMTDCRSNYIYEDFERQLWALVERSMKLGAKLALDDQPHNAGPAPSC